MGNYQSANIQCCIEKLVELKHGDNWLCGTVILNVHNVDVFQQSFDGISVMVIAAVKNPDSFSSEDSNIDVIPTTSTRSSKKVIKIKSVIDLSNTKVSKGQHVIPFMIALPTYQVQDSESGHNGLVPGRASWSTCDASVAAAPVWTDLQQHHMDKSERSGLNSSSHHGGNAMECSFVSSSSDESEISISPYCTTHKMYGPLIMNDPINIHTPEVQTTTTKTKIYQVKASLKRKPHVRLSVDTDIKCYAHCAEDAAIGVM
jgi:hypothetical protein